MANIDAALARCDADNLVFYEDEVDMADWMFRARQKRVVTPGQNARNITWQAFSMQATEECFTSVE